MSVAGEYQKILTEDKGLGAGIHLQHSLWRFYPMRKISSAWINAELMN